MKGARLALIGLDGGTFRVLDAVLAQGAMPALASLRERGAEAILHSTIPSYTPPAWVSIATGVNPGRHGIIGFLATTPQEEAKIAHSGLIDAPPMWRYLSEWGVPVGVFNVPMSYPPVPVRGFMVAGGLASGWTDPELASFASDPALARMVRQVAGGRYPLDVVVSYENDWRSPAVLDRIRDTQSIRRRALASCIERTDPSVVFTVFEGPDRIEHLHYQYLVEGSDWFTHRRAQEFRDLALAYFAELDTALAELAAWAGEDGHVVIVSDHGAGPWEKTVNLNLLLERWGFLRLPRASRLTRLGAVAGAGQRLARRVLPKGLLLRAKLGMSRAMDWSVTRAFAAHVAEQGIHVNERGALPYGIVEPADVGPAEAELAERLMELRDPHDGAPVTDRVIRRDEVIAGPHANRAPHLFPLMRDQRYELSDTLAAAAPVTDHRDRPWGYHHLDGIFVAAGPSVRPGPADALEIVDVLPTTFHMAGLPVPQGLDGRVRTEVLSPEARARPVSPAPGPVAPVEDVEYPFSPGEEAAIEESLRGLGYIE